MSTQLYQQGLATLETSKKLTITSVEEQQSASDLLKKVKQAQKNVEEFFEKQRSTAYAAYKAVTEQITKYKYPYEQAEKIIKKVMVDWENKQEIIKQAELKKLKEEQVKLTEQKLEEAGQADNEFDQNVLLAEAQLIEEQKLQVEKEKVEGMHTRKDWEISILDEESIPTIVNGVNIRPVDLGAVKKLVKLVNGNIDIPGIHIKETKIIVSK